MKIQCNCDNEVYTSMAGDERASWNTQKDEQESARPQKEEKYFRRKSQGKVCVKV